MGCPLEMYLVMKSVITAISTKVATVLAPERRPNDREASRKSGILKQRETAPMGSPMGKAEKTPCVRRFMAMLMPYIPPGTMPAGALNIP